MRTTDKFRTNRTIHRSSIAIHGCLVSRTHTPATDHPVKVLLRAEDGRRMLIELTEMEATLLGFQLSAQASNHPPPKPLTLDPILTGALQK